MAYKIIVEYTIGNSFGDQDTEDELSLRWENLDVAKENLQRIKEHQIFYESVGRGNYMPNADDEDYIQVMTKPWFVKVEKRGKLDTYATLRTIILKLDDGTPVQYGTDMWCGYFDSFHGARIEEDGEDLSFEI